MIRLSKKRYVQSYEHSISLRFRHPSMDPAELSRELELEPGHMWKAGDHRATQAGTPLAGAYTHSYWYANLCSLVASSDELLEAALVRLLDRFRASRLSAWNTVGGGGAELYVEVHGPSSFGFEFDPSLLADLAGMGITLSLEIFSEPQNS